STSTCTNLEERQPLQLGESTSGRPSSESRRVIHSQQDCERLIKGILQILRRLAPLNIIFAFRSTRKHDLITVNNDPEIRILTDIIGKFPPFLTNEGIDAQSL